MPLINTASIPPIGSVSDDDLLIIVRRNEPYYFDYTDLIGNAPILAVNSAIPRSMAKRSRDKIYLDDEFDITAADCSSGMANTLVKAASEGKTIVVPPHTGLIKIGDVPLQSNVTIEGNNFNGYGVSITGTTGFRMLSGASTIFLSNTADGVYMRDLILDGVNKTVTGITHGTTNLTLDFVTIHYCTTAIGGGATATTTVGLTCTGRSLFYGNNIAVDSPVKSKFVGITFTAQKQTTINLPSGADNNQFEGCRIEWNEGYAVVATDSHNNNFSGCQFDRNYFGAFHLLGSASVNVTGGWLDRNARDDSTADRQAHVLMDGTSSFNMCGTDTAHGVDDTGFGTDSPRYIVKCNSSTIANLTIIGGDSSLGYTVQDMYYTGSRPAKLMLDAVGITKERTGYPINYDTDGEYISKGSATIANTAAGAISLTNSPAIGTFSRQLRRLVVYVRDTVAGTSYAGTFSVNIAREGGSATMSASTIVGEIGTAGVLQFGAGTLNMSFSAVATDASTFTLNCTNTTGNSVEFYCRFEMP